MWLNIIIATLFLVISTYFLIIGIVSHNSYFIFHNCDFKLTIDNFHNWNFFLKIETLFLTIWLYISILQHYITQLLFLANANVLLIILITSHNSIFITWKYFFSKMKIAGEEIPPVHFQLRFLKSWEFSPDHRIEIRQMVQANIWKIEPSLSGFQYCKGIKDGKSNIYWKGIYSTYIASVSGCSFKYIKWCYMPAWLW